MNGCIPAKEVIPEILRKAKQDFDAACGKAVTRTKQGKKHKGNPSCNILQEYGVLFPNENDDYDSDSSDDVSTHLAKPDLIRAIPKNKEEETSQLEMAMQASMITSNRQPVTGNDYKFPANLYSVQFVQFTCSASHWGSAHWQFALRARPFISLASSVWVCRCKL